jgi:hypothetical protein
MAAALLGLMVSGAGAELTTERSASILVFPKVIANGTRDTIIQITNTSNSMVHAHCFYVNAAPTNSELPPDPVLNPPLWQEIDFDIWLTKQQPTHWVVSRGRAVNPQDPSCDRLSGTYACPDSGLDPGRVPPLPDDFVGELKCVEVDASGAPISGNHLKGEASIITVNACGPQLQCSGDGSRCWSDNDCAIGEACELAPENFCELTGGPCTASCPTTNDVAKYNAIGVIGNENNNGDPVLCLGGEPSDECQTGAEYDGCPETWILNHLAFGSENPSAGEGSFVSTTVTVVPCTQNYETQDPTTVTLQLLTYNEYEQVFSSSTSVTCWADLKLTDINNLFRRSTLASDFAQTRVRSSAGTQSGFMLVATEDHYRGNVSNGAVTGGADDGITGSMTPPYASAAVNAHIENQRLQGDLITIPAEQIQ